MDIDTCVTWASSHGIPVNSEKTVHLPFNCNSNHSFTVPSEGVHLSIKTVAAHKDLGVWTDHDLSPSRTCAESASKASRMLNFVRRTFPRISPKIFNLIYPTYVRSCLEYCSIAWLPFLKRDKRVLEQVQRRATKLVSSIRSLSYPDRLKALNLFPLEYRRTRGCLIYTFKLFQGGTQGLHFAPAKRDLRGHGRKVFIRRANTRLRKSFFSFVTAPLWNRLPSEVVFAPSLPSFKRRLDRVLPSLLPPTPFP